MVCMSSLHLELRGGARFKSGGTGNQSEYNHEKHTAPLILVKSCLLIELQLAELIQRYVDIASKRPETMIHEPVSYDYH
jgi:hypothetical protein